MNIFDNIKQRGVEDILFLSIDGVSGVEAGVKAIYPNTVVQRCIVHLIRNACKYIPSKHLKAFCTDCKAMYGATNLENAEEAFKELKEKWGEEYPGAVKVWENNFNHVAQLFNYGDAVKILDIFHHLKLSLYLTGLRPQNLFLILSLRSEEHTSELQSPDHLVCR